MIHVLHVREDRFSDGCDGCLNGVIDIRNVLACLHIHETMEVSGCNATPKQNNEIMNDECNIPDGFWWHESTSTLIYAM